MDTGPEPTASGHHVVIDGRRWRATDPSIPEDLRAELVSALMAARRAVRHDEGARGAVHDAKVALGERGEPWWEPTSEAGRRDRALRAARALLRHRDVDGAVTAAELAGLSPNAGISGDDARSALAELTGRPGSDQAAASDLPGTD